MQSDKYYFFWKHRLSQWHIVDFVVSGEIYNCCEQYMMAQKALLFHDYETMAEILKEKNPANHQTLGRKIKNFNQTIWDYAKAKIVYKGNYERFEQSQECRELLFSTGNLKLVEASPYDCVWGVGLEKEDPLILDEKNWRGQNLLGNILTSVREELKRKYNVK
jgi:ribA/ribD-fused uncharacterized protein